MNKIRCITVIIVLLFSIALCACNPTKNWKTVEIEGYGTMKVPENWAYSVVDGYVYFSLEEEGKNKPILVQHYSIDGGVNEYFATIEDYKWKQDEHFSNSTGVVKYDVLYSDGTSEELLFLEIWASHDLIQFICVDSSISEDTLKKIAKSCEYEYAGD